MILILISISHQISLKWCHGCDVICSPLLHTRLLDLSIGGSIKPETRDTLMSFPTKSMQASDNINYDFLLTDCPLGDAVVLCTITLVMFKLILQIDSLGFSHEIALW